MMDQSESKPEAKALPPPSDIKIYPPGDHPELILSAQSNYQLTTIKLNHNLTIYAESLSLAGTIGTNLTARQDNIKLHLYANSVHTGNDGVALDIRGKNGESAKDGGGAAGTDSTIGGGKVILLVENLDSSDLAEKIQVDVSGGNGGDGGSTNNAAQGGNGGKGTNGGNAIVALSGVVSRLLPTSGKLISELSSGKVDTKHLSAFKIRVGALTKTLEQARFPDNTLLTKKIPNLTEALETLNKEVNSPSLSKPQELVTPLTQLQIVLGGYNQGTLQTVEGHIRVAGGLYGAGGRGTSGSGGNGTRGKDGSFSVLDAGNIASLLKSSLIPAHPDQCAMLLEKAKTKYFIGDVSGLKECAAILKRLIDRLGFVSDIKKTDPLYKTYKEYEPSLYIMSNSSEDETIASIASLKNTWETASGLWKQMVEEQVDFYGQQYSYVPRGSYAFYDKKLKGGLTYLNNIQLSYAEYAQAGATEDKMRQGVNGMIAKCESIIGRARLDIEECKLRMDAAARKTSALDAVMKPAKVALDAEIAHVVDQINKVKVDGIPLKDVLEALGQIAFTHGSLDMVAIQALSLGHTIASTIPDDHGDKINKNLLIKQIKAISPTASGLKEGYKTADNGSWKPEDPGAAKLIASREKMMELIGSYKDALGGDVLAKVKARFDEYINATLARNEAIIEYNTCVTLWYRAAKNIEHYSKMESKYTDEKLSKVQMSLPALAVFMEKAYGDALSHLMEMLYRTQKALQFWSLNYKDTIASTLAGTPFTQLTPALLESVQEALIMEHNNAIENRRKPLQHFQKLRLSLPEDQLSTFKSENRLVWQIPAVGPPPDDKQDDDDDDSPFYGKADVRITRARLFVPKAVTKNGILQVNLRHMGNETIYDQQGSELEFSHALVDCLFAYELATGSYTAPGCFDGEIGDTKEAMFSNVGPFAMWSFTVDPHMNPGLKLDAVEEAYFEFDGTFLSLGQS